MIPDIRGYLFTDSYFELFAKSVIADPNILRRAPTGEGANLDPVRLEKTRHAKPSGVYDQTYLKRFTDPGDIPDRMTVDLGYTINLDRGRLHSSKQKRRPSIIIPKLVLEWFENSPKEPRLSASTASRAVGPAQITLTNVQKWHRRGVLHREGGPAITCKQLKAVFGYGGRWFRNDGPYIVTLGDIEMTVLNGEVAGTRVQTIAQEWVTASKGVLPQETFERIIAENELKVNPFSTTEYFLNPEDELDFLTKL